MTKCDFGNSFIIPLGNGAWEINPLYKPTPDIASHCPQFTLSTSVNTKPDLETEKAREAFWKIFGSHLFASGKCKTNTLPEIKKVIFNDPATIVLWDDGTKTVVKCSLGDTYSEWSGLAFCICKKLMGDEFHKTFKYWCKEDEIRSPIYDVCHTDPGCHSESVSHYGKDEITNMLESFAKAAADIINQLSDKL